MGETKPAPKAGDPCPQCGGPFVEKRAPTDAERAAAANHEVATAYPAGVDTAPADVREELGALQECAECHYRSRFHSEAARGDERRRDDERDERRRDDSGRARS